MLRLLTETDIAQAIDDLVRLDGRFAPVAKAAGVLPLRYRPPDYAALSSIIVSQMVSRASADAIWARLERLAGVVEPQVILALSEESLRSVGLSGAKIVALKALASACADWLDLSEIINLPAEQAIAGLTAVRGIGPWSAEVFLLFSAGHPDVFPAGDVALQTAAGEAFGLGGAVKPLQLRRMAEQWRPLRSAAACLLWAYYAAERRGAGIPVG